MRALRRLCLAPIILAVATTLAAVPAHQGGHLTQASARIAAHDCPAGSSWDNTLQACI